MRSVVQKLTAVAASATSIAALTTLGSAGVIPQGGSLATANGVANAQTLAGAGGLLLNGALALNNSVQFATPTRLNLQSTGNLSSINFTIVGIVAQGPDTSGNTGGPQTEVIAGPNNNIVTTQNTWISILTITASAAVATNVAVYGTATLANASQVELVSTNDLHTTTFTVSGFNANGQPLSETLIGPNNATVLTVNYFSAVTQVSTSAAVTAVSVGNGGTQATPWCPPDPFQHAFNVGVAVTLPATSTVNYTVQVTNDDPYGGIPYATPTCAPQTAPVAALVAQNLPQMANLSTPCRGIRMLISAGTGSATMTLTQGLNQ